MDAGTEVEVTAGKNGSTKTTTSYDQENNKLVKTDPINRVVKIGVKSVVKTEEIPHDTEFEYNPELKAGTKNLVEKGTPGKVTITTTFNKETGKLETTVERTEPKNAKYEYGLKTEGKVIVESDIPYEVEIIEDDTLDAGTHEVVREGVVGKKETTVVIENSKEKSRSDKTIIKAKNKIIKVGTKPTESMCPAPDPDKPDKPDQPDTPGGNTPGDKPNEPGTPSNPGDKPNEPGTPGNPGNKPNEPGTPGNPGDKPNEPNAPGNPGGDNPSHPENPNPSKPSNPDTSEGSVPGRASQMGEEERSRRATPSSFEDAKESDDRKAPQTFDLGVAAPAGLAALASGLLVGLESLKRRKRD